MQRCIDHWKWLAHGSPPGRLEARSLDSSHIVCICSEVEGGLLTRADIDDSYLYT